MKITDLFDYSDAKKAIREDPESGLESSIKKWQSILDALQLIYVVIKARCGLCVQHNTCCGCPISEDWNQHCSNSNSYYHKTVMDINAMLESTRKMLEFLKSKRKMKEEENAE